MSSLTADRWSDETSAAVSEWLRWALWSSLAVHIASVVVTSSPLARNAIAPEFVVVLARELKPISPVTMIYLAAVEMFWIAGKACVLAARPHIHRTTDCQLTLLSLAGDGLIVIGLAVILVRPFDLPLVISVLLLGTLGPLYGLRWAETRGGVTRGGMIAAEMSWMVLLIAMTGITLWVWGRDFLRRMRESNFGDLAIYSAPVLATLVLLLVGGWCAWSRKRPLTGKALGVVLLVAAAEGLLYYSLLMVTVSVLIITAQVAPFGANETAMIIATYFVLVGFAGLTVLGGRVVAHYVSKPNDKP